MLRYCLLAILGTVSCMAVKNLQAAHEKFETEHHKGGHNVEKDHEAILGSKQSADEYDHLTPEESKRRLRILAGKMDLNKDNMVDREELTDWIFASLRQLDEEEARTRFPDIDTDKDGEVNFEEYIKDSFGEEDITDPETKKFVDEDRQYFDAADRDANGKLSITEFAAFQRPENHEHMQEAMIRFTLTEKDANKDGMLTFEEFVHGIDPDTESEWYTVEKERFHDEHDKNKDGKLDREEIRSWLAPDIKLSAREEADHILHATKKSTEEKLSFDDIVAKYELWVGSEATGYGKHLDEL